MKPNIRFVHYWSAFEGKKHLKSKATEFRAPLFRTTSSFVKKKKTKLMDFARANTQKHTVIFMNFAFTVGLPGPT